MFTAFFYQLRASGIQVSATEWLSFTEALNMGLNEKSLTRFYYLARAVLVKSEADFDKYDQAFLEYFHGIDLEGLIPDEVMAWLQKRRMQDGSEAEKPLVSDEPEDGFELLDRLKDLLQKQKSEHHGGSHFIGTEGTAHFGHSGAGTRGVRIGGEDERGTAMTVAGQRRFRDFRNDQILDSRGFQMAFRTLRQLSTRVDAPKNVLNLDDTIRRTANNCGRLELVFEKPRKNTVKLMLLTDSGGSMEPYSALCAALFQAVSKSNHFHDLKIYYFHNCIKDKLYKSPHIDRKNSVETEWALNNISGDYKVIIVGDALMDVAELDNAYYVGKRLMPPPMSWLERFAARYERLLWLNPADSATMETRFWQRSYARISQVVEMERLTLTGLSRSFKKLMAAR